jgi:hypothetical protein
MNPGPSALVGGRSVGHPAGVEIDRNGLEVLGEDACLALLRGATLGRVAITSGALPTILPVNYRLVDRTVLFRTGRGTKLDAATTNAVVAFEVDDFDPVAHTGWSVNLIGVARDLVAVFRDLTFDTTEIPRWAPTGDDRVVAITAELITGRRIRHDIPTSSN